MTGDADVLVIGAGAAGLTCAQRLRAAGLVPLVLEATGRVGGRIHTDRTFTSHPLERGAEFVHGDRSLSARLAAHRGLALAPAMQLSGGRVVHGGAYTSVLRWICTTPSLWRAPLHLLAVARHRGPDLSLAELLERRAASPAFLRLADAIGNSMCSRPEALSVLELAKLSRTTDETGGDKRLVDGYDQLTGAMAQGIEVVTDAAVAEIDRRGSVVTIETDRGRFSARAAVVSLPLGVLKTGVPRFVPALPLEKQRAIDRLAMHEGMKIFIRFDVPLWDERTSFVLVDDRLPVVWTVRKGSPVLIALVMGHRAAHLARAGEGAANEIVASLARAFGSEVKNAMRAIEIVDWTREPFTRGGYSTVPSGAFGLREVLAAPTGPLHFAGEATDVESPATVSGAMRSGERAAREILERLATRAQ
jgi:monoamine oxidase